MELEAFDNKIASNGHRLYALNLWLPSQVRIGRPKMSFTMLFKFMEINLVDLHSIAFS